MDNQSSQSAFNAPALSNVPEIRSFEFDKTAIGNIKSSVNKFRGSVSLPVDFITLPGREGLDLKIAALYSSSVRNTLDTWNTDAPTGILGLGWQMPIEMIALDPAGSGSSTSNAYYLISNGSANPLVKTGQTDDGKSIFQLRNFHFWSVIYDPSNQVWTIVKENGFVYTYGSGTDTQSNATQWGVRWGNWMGSSSQHAAQVRYPLAWNLASIATPMGHRIQYRYHNVDRKVTATGLAFTQASYIKQVVDSYGRTITFAYGNKYGALNPDRSHGSQPIVEYQARHTQQAEPNAYQDRYETLFLDSVDVANADGQALYGLKFTYTFVNHAPTSDSHYSLLYKRCLHSVFQYAPDGETLPGMTFEYVAQTSDVNPGALNRVVYPSGGKASFVYKKNYIASPKRLTIPNPLANSTPRVWFGPDYVVFTYAGAAGMKVVVRSWNGHWVTQDITGVMGGKTPARDSLAVLTGEHFIAVSFRNSATNSDELYLFRNDDRGTELRFGSWSMYKSQGFILALGSQSAGASTFVAGEDFVMACNKDYTAGAFQGFSFAWQTGKWNATLTRDDGAPPVPPSTSAELAAIAAFQNYYVVSSYVTASRTIRTQLYYRELDGSWRSSTSNPWSLSNVDVVTSDGQAYLAVSPMPTGIVLTYVTGSQPTLIEYSLRIFQWNESFHVINIASSGSVDLQSPVTNKQSQFEIFRTAIVGALVNNNLAMLRNVGGDQTLASSWAKKLFVAPPPTATVVAASGDDVAVLCSSSGPTQQNQLITFNPNSGIWSAPAITQSGEYASVAGDYMTVGRCIYFRGTDGTWKQLTTQLNDLNYPNSVQNHGPRYIAYQNVDGRAASTYVVALKNGGATPLARLSMEKAYVPKEQAVAGTLLSGPRFLVTYPASADSFDSAASLTLYDLDDVNLEQHVLDTPVAYVEIEDSYDSSQNYYESFFYANSAESQIVYDAAVGVAQYPMVTVVQCVKDVAAASTTIPMD
jgi:hypothetical protein